MNRYYSRLRPVGPGTYPKDGAQAIHNYDRRQYVEDAGCEVWGYIDYDRELTEKETEGYELVPGDFKAATKTYSQLCVWPGTVLGENTVEDFEKFFAEKFGVRVKYEREVVTNGSEERGEEGGRHDTLFYIHNDDIPKFAVPRLMAGIRWWEDVVSYNDGAYLYAEDVLKAYPVTW